ncbi:GNAT family N-acetyltransferase [Tropicimonas sp. IMCC34043]|uniref:GNAT family N-acetyltransferase n=1 Tax=Tropicimonas sp. IMCC34043 TaxID=2248760 RepID=UPI0013009665|nr:GNAT family N-acetyltransferase [Tropicimonas sp. IMCC34043]
MREPLRGPVVLTRKHLVPIVLHYAQMTPEERYQRFNGKMPLRALLQRYSSINWAEIEFLAFMSGSKIVGLIELCDIPGEGEREAAISVLKDWQRQGLGEALVRAARERVCSDEHKSLIFYTQMTNVDMIRLAHKSGAKSAMAHSEMQLVIPAAA